MSEDQAKGSQLTQVTFSYLTREEEQKLVKSMLSVYENEIASLGSLSETVTMIQQFNKKYQLDSKEKE